MLDSIFQVGPIQFISAHGALVVVSIAAWFCILAFGSLAHKSLVRMVAFRGSGVAGSEMVADLAVAGVSRSAVISVLLTRYSHYQVSKSVANF